MNVKGREWIDFDDAAGLQIEQVVRSFSDTQLLVAFAGGRFAVIQAIIEDEEPFVETIGKDNFYPHGFDDDDISLVFGVQASREWNAEYAAKLKAANERQLEQDRKTYERLKKQFGSD